MAIPSHLPRFNAVVFPDELPGVWIAHCLELDILSQGDSPEHAMQLLCDALHLVGEDRILQGHAPWEIRPAPAACWARLAGCVPLGDFVVPSVTLTAQGDITYPSLSPEVCSWRLANGPTEPTLGAC